MSDACPLVLLPGWSLPAALFDSLRRALPAGWHVQVLPEALAASASDGLLAGMASAALAQAPPRAIWCGHSLGGLVALQAALQAPERVAGLLLLAATPSFVRRDGWASAMPAGELAAFAAGLDADLAGTLARFDALQCRGGEHARADLRTLRAWRADAADNAPSPARAAALRRGLQALAAADLRTAAARVQCPQTWLLGECDALVPAAAAREIRLLSPSARVVTCAAANHLLGLAGDARDVRDALAGLRASCLPASGTASAPLTESR